MPQTALDLNAEGCKSYRPQVAPAAHTARWQRAVKVAEQMAALLRDKYQASRVVAFGSLTDQQAFTRWSDIDLAAWGIPQRHFFRAVGDVTGVSAEFSVDLVDAKSCSGPMIRRIEQEGMDV
jgi:predicted nucleotidyltransferase